MNYIKIIIVITILYFELTLGEVLIHKYIMHNNPNSIIRKIYGDDHIIHHLDVKSDMKLADNYNEKGLYFSPIDALYVSIIVFICWYPTLLLFYPNIEKNYIIGLSILIGIIYKVLWDYLHYSFHQLTELESKDRRKLI